MFLRRATYQDIPRLMEIFHAARQIMRKSGNLNQWSDGYPSEKIVRSDIDNEVCIVMCDKADGKIIATMAFIPGPDPTYAELFSEEDLSATLSWPYDGPYHVIHRIAVCEPGHRAAEKMLDWAFCRLIKDNPRYETVSIRIDTHKDNVIMHHILGSYGFTRCGIIYLANGDPRTAYQKQVTNNNHQ